MMKILVPIDGSKASMNAVEAAVKITETKDSVIKIITVVNLSLASNLGDIIFVRGNIQEYDNELLKIYKKRGAELLDSVAAKYDSVKFEKEVLTGEPYEEIIEKAKNEKIDLIVIGNRGFSKIKRFFLGSVAQRVIAEAPCPVLVIHAEAEE